MNLTNYLKYKNISQAEAGRNLKVSRSHINCICKGKRFPSSELAFRIEKWSENQISLREQLKRP